MKRIAVLTLLILGGLTASAQIQYPYIVVAPSDPTGNSCSGPQLQTVFSTGKVYSCNNGTLASVGGSGTFNALTGDATSTATGGATTVVGLNGTLLSGLATGILKNTTSTGVPSIAVAGTDYAAPATSNTFTQPQSFTGSGAASTAQVLVNGTWFVAGSASTNYPALYVKGSGAADGNLQTNGNGVVINAPSGFNGSGFLLMAQTNGGSPLASINGNGIITSSAGYQSGTLVGIGTSGSHLVRMENVGSMEWTSSGAYTGTTDTTLCRSAAGIVEVGSSTGCANSGTFLAQAYTTAANCTSSASPAVCAAATAGSVVVAASATTVVVDTTAVTANSQVFVQEDSSLGTKLSVTCNVTPATAPPTISARTGGTSFTITTTSPTTNPRCFSYWIIN